MRRLLRNDDLCDAIAADWRCADLTARQRAIAIYAEDLTLRPSRPDPTLFVRLREVGLDDTAILAVTEIAAYFNFVNRMATALGVELEAELANHAI